METPQYEISRQDTEVNFFPYPLLIVEEKQGDSIDRIGFFVASDIDGTANQQEDEFGKAIPESVRLQTIYGTADVAFSALEQSGIPVWLISSRTYPEVKRYQNALQVHGGAVIEDGLGIVLPNDVSLEDVERSYPGYHLVHHEDRDILVLASKNSMERLIDFYDQIESLSGEEFISSITKGSEEKLKKLQETAGHENLESAFASTVRFASSYIPKPTERQRALVHEKAEEYGVRVFDDGHVIHCMSDQATKATALSFFYDNPQLFFPGVYVNKIFPIACGNHVNDIKLMHQALSHKGVGVMVAGPRPDTYYVKKEDLPEGIVLTHEVAGKGLLEAVPIIKKSIRDRFVVDIP
jgi:hydroxymethylpyrimidine pyrophosphatase-like HAD family hydrolase